MTKGNSSLLPLEILDLNCNTNYIPSLSMLYSDVLMLSYISHMLLPFVRAKDLVDPQEKGIGSTGGTQGQL